MCKPSILGFHLVSFSGSKALLSLVHAVCFSPLLGEDFALID